MLRCLLPLALVACASTSSAASFPSGVTVEPSGRITVLSAPPVPPELFPTRDERESARQGVTADEAVHRRELINELMHLQQGWQNAIIEREPRVLHTSYMDWDAVGETGRRGVQIVLVESEFPEATLSYYVTHPNIRAVSALQERAAIKARREAYVTELAALGVRIKAKSSQTIPGLGQIPTEPNAVVIDAATAPADLPPPPPGVRLIRDGQVRTIPAFVDGMEARFREDQRIPGGFGITIEPAHRGTLVARDGCLYIQYRGGEHLAVLPAYGSLGRDAEGWPALLDAYGLFEARIGTEVTFTGGGRVSGAPQASECPAESSVRLVGVRNQRPRPDFAVPTPPKVD